MKMILLLAVVTVAFASQECGENAHFESCGTACPLTCSNYQDPPKFCFKSCNIGCHCDKGYVKSIDGRCIRPEQCTYADKNNCVDAPDSGVCYASFRMWYYDASKQKCQKFVYGGCGGNGNRYWTEKECMQKCQGVAEVQKADLSACDLLSESGVCRGFFQRFYFDRTTGQCEKFVYGGCGGNENNFETIEECQRTCGSVAPSPCSEELAVGPCRGQFRRFYFNKETGECEQFTYGGCRGNSNNFISLDDCEAICKA